MSRSESWIRVLVAEDLGEKRREPSIACIRSGQELTVETRGFEPLIPACKEEA